MNTNDTRSFFWGICLFLFIVSLTSCNESSEKSDSEGDTAQISPYEEFTNKFSMADSVPNSFDNDNSLEWYTTENAIEDTLFNGLLKEKAIKGFKNQDEAFASTGGSYYYAGRIPLSEKYNSFLIAEQSDSPTHKWKIYLVNFSLVGDFRDAILLSYRDSYMSTREDFSIRTGEYRTAEFLEGQRIRMTDVVYDNRVDNPNITDPEEKPIEDERYKSETVYQLKFDGTFKILRAEEKPQDEATPE